MERLSDTAIEIINELHTERLDYSSEYIPLIDAANRLAAYEDTGLEPEDVRRLMQDWTSLIMTLDELGGMPHLRELVQAEQDGPHRHGCVCQEREQPAAWGQKRGEEG